MGKDITNLGIKSCKCLLVPITILVFEHKIKGVVKKNTATVRAAASAIRRKGRGLQYGKWYIEI